MDDVLKWISLGITALGAAFGYGHLHQRVSSLESVQSDNSHKLDQILSQITDVRERLARLEGR